MSQLGRFLFLGPALFFLVFGFSAYAQPRITGYAPGDGPPGTIVTIVGTGLVGPGFVPGTGQRVIVLFTGGSGSGAAAQILDFSVTALRVIVPEGARSGPISVFTSQGQTSTLPFSFYLPPKVTDFGTEFGEFGQFIKPVVGRSGMTLRIKGENFVPPLGNTVVRVAGRLFTRTVVSDSQIDVQLGVPAVNGPVETGPISVATVVGTNVTTEFVYGQPIVDSFTPKAVAGAEVSLNGFNLRGRLASEISVKFGGIAANEINMISNTNITAVLPAAALSGPITFSAPGGSFITTSNFTVLPSIIGFNPNTGPAGTVVTINGSGLNGTTQVRFGNVVASTITNLSQLQVTTLVPNNVPTGPLTIITQTGTNISTALFYGVPDVESVTPLIGDVGTIVTVTGGNFTGATQVQLNGVSVPAYSVINNSTITFPVPLGATSGKVKVSAPGGSDESVTSFTVRGPEPSITSFTPNSGPPGTQVVIRGANLPNATSVTFNGATAIFTVIQQTNLQATVPANATTGPIRVTNPSGSAQSSTDFVVGTSADVRVTITGTPNPAVAFGTLVYNIQAFNNGPLPAEDSVIEVTIPASTSIIDATGSVPANINGRIVSYDRGQMDPGGVFTGTVQVNAGAPAEVVAVARFLTSTPDTNPDNNVRSVTNRVATPRLDIENVASLGVLLSWPSAAGSLYQLNSAPRLDGAFTPVSGNIVDDGVRFQLVVEPTNSLELYRLELLPQ